MATAFPNIDAKLFTIVSKLPINNIFGKCGYKSYAFTCTMNFHYSIINLRRFESTKETISKYLYPNINDNIKRLKYILVPPPLTRRKHFNSIQKKNNKFFIY